MKNNSLISKLKTLKKQLTFPITKQPTEIKKVRTRIIIRTIVVEFLFSVFAFAIKGAQLAIQRNLTIIAVIILALYFSERVIQSAYNTYRDFQEDNFKEIYTSAITSIIMELACMTQSKVFKTNQNGVENSMQHPELIRKTKDYMDAVWNFWWMLPIAISQIITLLVMIIATLVMEIKSGGSTAETTFMMSLLGICIVIYFIFGKKRIDVMKQYRKKRKENEAIEENLYVGIKSTDFSSKQDFEYHAQRFINHLITSKELLRNERLKLNSVFIKRSAVASIFMIIILVYKIFTGGTVTEEVVLGVIAISTVYSTILNKITDILSLVEDTVNYLIDIDKLYDDFDNINSVYYKELEKQQLIERTALEPFTENSQITVKPFEFSYNKNNDWKLMNQSEFKMVIGDTVLVKGETGCGKTTTGRTISGETRISESPIYLSNGKPGYLKTLTYHTDRFMVDNYILNEIILSDTFENLDKNKLFEILEGLELKEIFVMLAKNEKSLKEVKSEEDLILAFMKLRTYKQFSSGQQQRITLAKLLYTLDSSIQAVWLDEPFNRLNDQVAYECTKFITNYLQRDRKRLVMIASHQVEIITPFCSKELYFERREDGSSVIKFHNLGEY